MPPTRQDVLRWLADVASGKIESAAHAEYWIQRDGTYRIMMSESTAKLIASDSNHRGRT